MIVIPAIDIQGGRCVRASPGATRPDVVYADDPVQVARLWSRHGARWLHVIDLEGVFAGRPVQLDLVRAIAGVGVPLQVGGGFRTLADLEAGLVAGAARVLLDSAALALAREASRRFGDRVAVLVRVGGGRVVDDPVNASSDPVSLGNALAACGIRRIIYTDVAHDGTLTGPDIPALEAFVRGIPIPVVAAGGVASRGHLVALERIGVEGVVVGRALYEGRLHIHTLTSTPQPSRKAAEKTATD